MKGNRLDTGWIWLDPEVLNVPRIEEESGVKTIYFASPYDVPDAFRSLYTPNERRFCIMFRYAGSSEPIRAMKLGRLILSVGKNSRRVYSINMDTRSLAAVNPKDLVEAVKDECREIIDRYAKQDRQQHQWPSRQDHYRITEQVLAEQKDVFAPLASR